MAKFKWKGIDEGKYVTDEIEAHSKEDAVYKLKQRNVIISLIEKVGEGETKEKKKLFGASKKIPPREILIFTKKLSTMLKAGLPILNTLEMLKNQVVNDRFRGILESVYSDVEAGKPFSDSIQEYAGIFDNIYVNMCRAGEESGKLDLFLEKLVKNIEKTQKIIGQIKGAMFYPAILLFVAVSVISVMMIFVVPVFVQMFSEVGGSLPLPTRIVIAISDFLRNPYGGGTLLIAIITAFLLFRFFLRKSYTFRLQVHRQIFRIPVLGDLVLKSSLSKIALVQSNLTSAGVPILKALDIIKATASNLVINNSLDNVKKGVYSGDPMSALLEKEEVFPLEYSEMVAVGEKTGNMEDMLTSIANYYEEEFDIAVQRMTSLMEPIMIVFMGVTIGFIIVAMYMPIFMMGQTMM